MIKFTELNLPAYLLTALERIGFTELTPIQEATYPIISAGKDLCGLAETGSGKTAACAIPIIQMVDPELNQIQALIIVPTRELCLQYVDEIHRIAEGSGIITVSIFGGSSKEIQAVQLNHIVHIVVATPGRLIDFLYDGLVDFSHVKCAILDEADELLKEGFFRDIKFLLSCIRVKHQTLLFSATMAEEIKQLAHDCMVDPVHVNLISEQSTPISIDHHFIMVAAKYKMPELLKVLNKDDVNQVIIFCNSRMSVDKLWSTLKSQFRGVEYIHAGLTQDKRTSLLYKFKGRRVRILIATDVAGRGLDFSHVSHVINWNLPAGDDQYAHRTGRTGRMGRKGFALTFITSHDLLNLKRILASNSITPIWIGKDPLKSSKTT